MKKWISILLFTGLLLFVCSYGWEVAMINIPPQDPPPDIAKAYAEHDAHAMGIAVGLYYAGALFVLSAVVLLICRAAQFLQQKRRFKNSGG